MGHHPLSDARLGGRQSPLALCLSILGWSTSTDGSPIVRGTRLPVPTFIDLQFDVSTPDIDEDREENGQHDRDGDHHQAPEPATQRADSHRSHGAASGFVNAPSSVATAAIPFGGVDGSPQRVNGRIFPRVGCGGVVRLGTLAGVMSGSVPSGVSVMMTAYPSPSGAHNLAPGPHIRWLLEPYPFASRR